MADNYQSKNTAPSRGGAICINMNHPLIKASSTKNLPAHIVIPTVAACQTVLSILPE